MSDIENQIPEATLSLKINEVTVFTNLVYENWFNSVETHPVVDDTRSYYTRYQIDYNSLSLHNCILYRQTVEFVNVTV